MKRVYPVEEHCIGCHLCEVACAVAHSVSGDVVRAYKIEGCRPLNMVEELKPVSFCLSCRHCEEPHCVAACISGALYKDAEGRTAYDESKCVGCWSCVMACPHGGIRQDTVRMKIIKCDLCPGRDTPACVSACPNRALVYEESCPDMYVIIGGGVAAVGAIEGIRSRDRRTQVTLLSKENYPVYARPLIVEFLKGERSEEEMLYRSPGYYDQMKVKVRLASEVAAIDTAAKSVTLASGEKLAYRKLLVATGGVPFVPPIEGLQGPDVYTFTTLDDAKRLSEAVPGVNRAVVIGGGLIGLKVAEGLHARGVHVTIVELAPRILSAAFDDTAGKIIFERLAEVGIDVLVNCSVKTIVRNGAGRVTGVRLTDSRAVECAAVVAAIGVAPNKALAQASGLEVNRGIVVNNYLRTSAAGVYAAGDVAEAYDASIGERRVVPIWPNAYLQGFVAGQNMAGARRKYEGGLPMNSIAFYGIPTISAGTTNPPNGGPKKDGYEIMERLDPARHFYRKLILKRGRLVGYVLVGEVKRAGLLTGLIRDEIDVRGFKEKLMSEGVGYLDLPAELRRSRLS